MRFISGRSLDVLPEIWREVTGKCANFLGTTDYADVTDKNRIIWKDRFGELLKAVFYGVPPFDFAQDKLGRALPPFLRDDRIRVIRAICG